MEYADQFNVRFARTIDGSILSDKDLSHVLVDDEFEPLAEIWELPKPVCGIQQGDSKILSRAGRFAPDEVSDCFEIVRCG